MSMAVTKPFLPSPSSEKENVKPPLSPTSIYGFKVGGGSREGESGSGRRKREGESEMQRRPTAIRKRDLWCLGKIEGRASSWVVGVGGESGGVVSEHILHVALYRAYHRQTVED